MPTREALPRPPQLRDLRSGGEVSLFLDFDGTLVELAPTPDGINVPPDLAARLHDLADQMAGRVAVVSGRAIVDLERHMGALSLARAGSHGSDCRMADGQSLGAEPKGLSAAARDEITRFAAKSGFSLEDKPHGAALHYRHDHTLEEEGMAFANALAENHGLDVKRGKCVIELVAPGANKGSAVEAFMVSAAFAGSVPIFIGDDVTDEDGFVAVQSFGGFGILVGDREDTAARYRLADPATVYQWLEL